MVAIWARRLKGSFDLGDEATVVKSNKNMVIVLANDAKIKKSSKQIDVYYHPTLHFVKDGSIKLENTPGGMLVADCLTKALDRTKFEVFRSMIGLINCMRAEGEC